MRVNIYGEELTNRVELISKEVKEEKTGEVFTFYGLRFYLKFPNSDWWIHRKVDGELDDDSSAVTFWAPTREKLLDMMRLGIETLVNGEPTKE